VRVLDDLTLEMTGEEPRLNFDQPPQQDVSDLQLVAPDELAGFANRFPAE